ncbi:MAG TPA: hypothetical protein VKP88_02385, partial [Candidatus Paceibacterota bacterium]|nr:hypothetical protein [Candidatus Paceibacterota bacterium]
MALRFYYEFQNDKAETWRVEIHDDLHGGGVTEVSAAGEGFTLTYDGADDDLYQAIVGSKATFELYNRDDYSTEMDDFLSDLHDRKESELKVAIYFDPDDTNTLYWAGVIFTEDCDVENVSNPALITLVAGDDISSLKAVPYNDDGTAYTGVASFLSHIVNCLNKTRTSPTYTTAFWDTSDAFFQVHRFVGYNDGTTFSLFAHEDIGFAHEDMYGEDAQLPNNTEYRNAYEILTAICDVMAWSLMLV